MNRTFEINEDKITEYTITLLECQVEIILRSLELYNYTYRFIAPHKKPQSREEEYRIALVRDTYEAILDEYTTARREKEKENEKQKNII